MKIENVKITDFAKRHFDSKFGGTKILDSTPEDFERKVNQKLELINSSISTEYSTERILPGYADFCKLVVVKNFTNARTGTLPITLDNYQYLRTGYSARRDGELPVLSRWFELPLKSMIPTAMYLIIILYDKNQLNKEMRAEIENGMASEFIEFEGEWGIVSIQGVMFPNADPIPPSTIIRNKLGVNFGGSGAEINKDEYEDSVRFWEANALIK